MRNRLFLAFLAVAVIALISNLIYLRLSTRDFEEYVRGSKGDALYWVLATVEGSYQGGEWNMASLHEAVHWALMLGFEVRVQDTGRRDVITSAQVEHMLAPEMRRRMEGISDLSSVRSGYEAHPLFMEGREIGTMFARELARPGETDHKEELFLKRGRYFLMLSFVIAGSGAIALSVILSLYFGRPLRVMKEKVEAMARGDLETRMPVMSGDEIGMLADSFNYMAAALQKEEAIRKHLTSNVAHELRTPLTVMKANVEAMMDGVVTDTQQGLENLRLETEKLIHLVEGIEDLTKAEESFFGSRESSELDLPGFLGHIVTKMLPVAAAKGLELSLVGSGPLVIHTEPDKLERIVENIVSNAIRYTTAGSVRLEYRGSGHDFLISVTDSGPGIQGDLKKQVFKRFSRGSESKGLGLGLAIVKELLDTMGGKIEILDALPAGTQVLLTLPDRTEGPAE